MCAYVRERARACVRVCLCKFARVCVYTSVYFVCLPIVCACDCASARGRQRYVVEDVFYVNNGSSTDDNARPRRCVVRHRRGCRAFSFLNFKFSREVQEFITCPIQRCFFFYRQFFGSKRCSNFQMLTRSPSARNALRMELSMGEF